MPMLYAHHRFLCEDLHLIQAVGWRCLPCCCGCGPSVLSDCDCQRHECQRLLGLAQGAQSNSPPSASNIKVVFPLSSLASMSQPSSSNIMTLPRNTAKPLILSHRHHHAAPTTFSGHLHWRALHDVKQADKVVLGFPSGNFLHVAIIAITTSFCGWQCGSILSVNQASTATASSPPDPQARKCAK